jgi:hypothetical protein
LQRKKEPEEEHFEVWDENWETVMMFLRMQTQWNVTMGGYVGFGMLSLYDVDNPREMLEGIQAMEAVALSELNKEKK